jgi:L-asparaginase/Glu-tRNA(Gln) amidotransferase subunit D
MGFYVLVQPEEASSAMTVEHSIGHPSLIIESDGSTIAVQISGPSNGAALAANFARQVAAAATQFARRCDELAKVNIADLRSSALRPGEVAPPRRALGGER